MQIHHADGDRANNDPQNLAVACLDCHSRVTGRSGLGKSYTPAEVRKYKAAWEKHVFDSRGVRRPAVKYQKELISQIDLVVCEILASKTNSPRIEVLLNLLYELHIWRGNGEIEKKIIEGLSHLAVMSGLGSPRLAALVAQKLWEMCWHLAGPDQVPMWKKDLAMVLDCLDALRTLATFNCEFGHGRKPAAVIAKQIENFFDVSLWYSRRRIANAVIRIYDKALRGCYTRGKLEFGYGRTILRRSVRRVRGRLIEGRPGWRHQRRRLDQLLLV